MDTVFAVMYRAKNSRGLPNPELVLALYATKERAIEEVARNNSDSRNSRNVYSWREWWVW